MLNKLLAVVLLLVVVAAHQVDAFAAQTPKNGGRKVVEPYPGASHHTEHHQNRPETPGKHRQGAWYNPEKSKKNDKNGDDNGNKGGGRAWSYGKVSWW